MRLTDKIIHHSELSWQGNIFFFFIANNVATRNSSRSQSFALCFALI